MKKDAEAHAEEDQKARELVETRNKAEQVVHGIRKQLEEHGAKVSSEARGRVESAINDVETMIKGDDAQAIDRSLGQLQTAAAELGKVIYEQAAADGAGGDADAGGDAGGKGGKDEDVIDAEYEVKE